MRRSAGSLLIILALLLGLCSFSTASQNNPSLSREEFDRWPAYPEYTVFNPFPYKGANCTWYAHGRMLQLGYCQYALDSMRFHARYWAESADRGAVVTDVPAVASIACWDGGAFYGSVLGHVAVVEEVKADGSILVSDSSISGSPYKRYTIRPGSSLWPTSFIIVPPGPARSNGFYPGQMVRTTVSSLNFRLEGVDVPAVLLPGGTLAKIKDHPSNGIYASPAPSRASYHHWWYAAVELHGEIRHGWLAETYLEAITLPQAGTAPAPDHPPAPLPQPLPEVDSQAEKGPENTTAPDVNPAPQPFPEAESDPVIKYGDIDGDGQVDVRDVAAVMQYMMMAADLEEDQVRAADVNGDGMINIQDVVLIMQYALGLIDSF